MRVPPLPKKIMLECIYPDWLNMERMLEAVLSGDKSMMLFGVLEAKETKSYEHGLETLAALFNIEPNEPMVHVESIDEHFAWPKNW